MVVEFFGIFELWSELEGKIAWCMGVEDCMVHGSGMNGRAQREYGMKDSMETMEVTELTW
jgi:hypothetical protein